MRIHRLQQPNDAEASSCEKDHRDHDSRTTSTTHPCEVLIIGGTLDLNRGDGRRRFASFLIWLGHGFLFLGWCVYSL
ncbi:MAG TPA: hypothetical protein VJV78_17315 [Polyangiales bacterium]|nr:hypothetical protein [Polyangiales bacterium]